MIRSRNTVLIGMLVSLSVSMELQAQYSGDIQAELERRAASDADLAAALGRMSLLSGASNYSQDELLKNFYVECFQYRLSPDPQSALSVEMRGRGSIGATLGSGIGWTDKTSGETRYLSYQASTKSLPEGGLAIDVTIEQEGQPSVTTEYVFENFSAVTVLLREFEDGSRHLARFVPRLDQKTTLRDYGSVLTMSLTSAALLVDEQFAGEFTVSGEIIGITSSEAGMMFEFGLKPFVDAAPIGRTDGRTIRFEHDGHRYKLYSTEPITKSADVATEWNVYVRVNPTSALGSGTHSKTHDSTLVQGVVESLTR